MMDRVKEAELFDYLARHRPLKEWLDKALAEQMAILLVNPDHGVIRKAQGAAEFITRMQDKLSASEKAAKH